MIQIDSVSIIAMFGEGMMYGIAVVLYIIALAVLLRKRRKPGGVNKPMLLAIILMWSTSTLHVCADLVRLMIAFLSAPEGPNAYLTSISTTVYFVRGLGYVLQILTGDGFILYRLYLVWAGYRRVCIPMFLVFVANIVVGGGVAWSLIVAQPGAPVFSVKRWIATLFALTLFTNFICSALIALRIWMIHRQTAELTTMGSTERSMVPAATIIIESGAIYSLFLTLQISLFASNQVVQYIVSDMTIQLIGVVFSLVIVRVGLGVTIEPTAASRNQGTLLSTFAVASRRTRAREQDTFASALDPVEVHISKVVTQGTHSETDTLQYGSDKDVGNDASGVKVPPRVVFGGGKEGNDGAV